MKYNTIRQLCLYHTLVLVSNKNMYIDIKPYFYLPYRSILKYRGMRCFPGETFQTLLQVFVVSQNVNQYGSLFLWLIIIIHNNIKDK